MLALQAGVVAAPRAGPRAAALERVRGRGWALVPIGSIVLVIFAIRFLSDTATGLTDLALVAVPPLAAVALAWAGWWAAGDRQPHAWTAPAAVVGTALLFALAWAARRSLLGEGAAALLSALSCVTLGVLLAIVTPPGWLKAGIVAMAAADTWLVVSDLLQAPNATLIAAHPPAGLPRLQTLIFGSVSMGYGDMFVAALLGAVLARERPRQRLGALLTLMIAAVFDLLFLVLAELPATVPVALALIAVELLSAGRRRSRPAGAPPRPAR